VRAAIVAVQLPEVDDAELGDSIAELRRLAQTLGHEVTAAVTQRRARFEPGTYVGAGKRGEIKALVDAGTAEILLVDHEITPSQARNLEQATGARVMDRSAVILEIFQRHAHSRAARAQVEIVRL
jgi:GTP-binding protein HflX